MNTFSRTSIRLALLACLIAPAMVGHAQENPVVSIEAHADSSFDKNVVSIGHDAILAAGESANRVVSIMGTANSAGTVSDRVVSVLGETIVTGPVGDRAVAVLGNNHVNSHVTGDVVAVLGDVELGPQAVVDGKVVSIGGTIKRDPAAVVHGGVENVFAGHFHGMQWLKPWIQECLIYARPLALAPGLGWAWELAFGFLALYLLLAALFRDGVERCTQTLEAHPGRSILAAFLALLLTPLLFLVLLFTVIGIAAIPFVGFGLFCALLFGKAVMLAWIGRRFTKPFTDGPGAHPAVSVLIGGIVVLALYLVPVVGFIVYKLLGILGLGVVLYTLIRSAQRNRVQPEPAVAAEPTPATPPLAAADVPAVTLLRAGFWIRMVALFLDAVLIGILLSLLLHHSARLELIALAIYGVVMWKLKGSTIGGIICGLQVVRLDGRPVDWATSTVRALGCFLSLAIAGLGFFWIVFDDGKQAWHDKIAGTVVVRAPKGVSLV